MKLFQTVAISLISALFFVQIPTSDASQSELDQFNGTGGFGTGSFFEIGAQAASAGVYTKEELAYNAEIEFSQGSRQLVIGDLNFFGSFFFGKEGIQTGAGTAFYQLRLEGSLSGGLQAWRVVPLTLSLEDGTYIKTPEGSRSSALLGSTLYFPFNLSNGDQVLFLAVTAGGRLHSEIENAAFAIQPKIRYVSDRLSAEIRYLMRLSAPEAEEKIAASASLRRVFREFDEIGIAYSQTWTEVETQSDLRGANITIHYGIQF
jgi:hypothetical protein